jgi:two-component system response regulator RegA
MATATRVLVVDDDPLFLKLSRRALEHAGVEATLAGSIAEARGRMFNNRFDVAILDYFLRAGECGCDLIPSLRERYPGIRVVILSGLGAVAEIIHHAHAAGADLVESKTRVDWDALVHGGARPAVQADPALSLAALRREIIHGALLVHRYNISATARALGIKRSTLQRALRRTPALRSGRGCDPGRADPVGIDPVGIDPDGIDPDGIDPVDIDAVGMEAGRRGRLEVRRGTEGGTRARVVR